jgi:hypothetical protein
VLSRPHQWFNFYDWDARAPKAVASAVEPHAREPVVEQREELR